MAGASSVSDDVFGPNVCNMDKSAGEFISLATLLPTRKRISNIIHKLIKKEDENSDGETTECHPSIISSPSLKLTKVDALDDPSTMTNVLSVGTTEIPTSAEEIQDTSEESPQYGIPSTSEPFAMVESKTNTSPSEMIPHSSLTSSMSTADELLLDNIHEVNHLSSHSLRRRVVESTVSKSSDSTGRCSSTITKPTRMIETTAPNKRKRLASSDARHVKHKNVFGKPMAQKTRVVCEAFVHGVELASEIYSISSEQLVKWMNADISQCLEPQPKQFGKSHLHSDVDSWILEKQHGHQPITLLEVYNYAQMRANLEANSPSFYSNWASGFINAYDLNLIICPRSIDTSKEHELSGKQNESQKLSRVHQTEEFFLDFSKFFKDKKKSDIPTRVGLLLSSFIHGYKETLLMYHEYNDEIKSKYLSDLNCHTSLLRHIDLERLRNSSDDINKEIYKFTEKRENINFPTLRRFVASLLLNPEQYEQWAKKFVVDHDLYNKLVSTLRDRKLKENTMASKYQVKKKLKAFQKRKPMFLTAEKKAKETIHAFIVGCNVYCAAKLTPKSTVATWLGKFNVMPYIRVTQLQKEEKDLKYKSMNRYLLRHKKLREKVSLTQLRAYAKEIHAKDPASEGNSKLLSEWCRKFVRDHQLLCSVMNEIRSTKSQSKIQKKKTATSTMLSKAKNISLKTCSSKMTTSALKKPKNEKLVGNRKSKVYKTATISLQKQKLKSNSVAKETNIESERSKISVVLFGKRLRANGVNNHIRGCLVRGMRDHVTRCRVKKALCEVIMDVDISGFNTKTTKVKSTSHRKVIGVINESNTEGTPLTLSDLRQKMRGTKVSIQQWVGDFLDDKQVAIYVIHMLNKQMNQCGSVDGSQERIDQGKINETLQNPGTMNHRDIEEGQFHIEQMDEGTIDKKRNRGQQDQGMKGHRENTEKGEVDMEKRDQGTMHKEKMNKGQIDRGVEDSVTVDEGMLHKVDHTLNRDIQSCGEPLELVDERNIGEMIENSLLISDISPLVANTSAETPSDGCSGSFVKSEEVNFMPPSPHVMAERSVMTSYDSKYVYSPSMQMAKTISQYSLGNTLGINMCILSAMKNGIVNCARSNDINMKDLNTCMNFNVGKNLQLVYVADTNFPFQEVKQFIEKRQELNEDISVSLICQFVYELLADCENATAVEIFYRWADTFIASYNIGIVINDIVNSVGVHSYSDQPVQRTSTYLGSDKEPALRTLDNNGPALKPTETLLTTKREVILQICEFIFFVSKQRNLSVNDVYKWMSEDRYKFINMDKCSRAAATEPIFKRLIVLIKRAVEDNDQVSILFLCSGVYFLAQTLQRQSDTKQLLLQVLDFIEDDCDPATYAITDVNRG